MLAVAVTIQRPTQKWLPVVDAARCTGCGLCVDACGPACLDIAGGIAVLTRPDPCGSEEHCIAACADDAIRMAWLQTTGDTAVGRWRIVRRLPV